MKNNQRKEIQVPDPLQTSREMILALEKELAELKADFQNCRAELQIQEAQTLQRIEKDANKAVYDASDRMMRFQEFAKTSLTWVLGLIVVGLTVLGVGGFFGVKNRAEELVISEVTSWLKFTNESSPLREPLSRLTTRSIVDVLVMERARSDLRAPYMRDIKITGAWVDKLITDLINPSTSEPDFTDLALALGTEATLTTGGEYRGKILERINTALLGDSLPPHRKSILLRTFGFEIALRDTALTLFQKSKDIEVQGAAFQLLRRNFVPSAVAQLGRPILETSIPVDDYLNKRLQLLAAESLAEADPDDAALKKWMNDTKQRGENAVIQNAVIGLAALKPIPDPKSWLGKPMPSQEKAKRLSFALSQFATAIKGGASVSWRDEFAGRPIIGLKTESGDFEAISDPRAVLTDLPVCGLLDRPPHPTQKPYFFAIQNQS